MENEFGCLSIANHLAPFRELMFYKLSVVVNIP